MVISSTQNPKIKELVKLHEKKDRDQQNLFLIEGEHLVEEALKSNCLKELIVLEDFNNFAFENITVVTTNVMAKLSKQKTIPKMIGLCHQKPELDIHGNVLLIDNVQDPGNMGTIIRNAVAFNIETIIISPDSVDLYNEKVIRSTEGLIFWVNIITKPLIEEIKELKLKNYRIIASVVANGQNVSALASKYALIVGNEGQGINKELLSLSDEKITINISPKVESLNVGVATGIILYELNRR